jgi:hypothetical protein
LVIIVSCNNLPPLHGIPYAWNTASQMPGQICERYTQFSDSPKAKKTPDQSGPYQVITATLIKPFLHI